MARPVIVPVDALALVRDLMRAAPELAGVPIALRSPRDTSSPWVRLSLIGGADAPVPVPTLLIATFDVASFAPPEITNASGVAHDLARRCLGVLRASIGYGTIDGSIARVETTTGIAYEPDESRTPPTPRFVFTPSIYVVTHAQEAA